MLKYIGILIVGILTSFYFFPFEFAILPGANTKMVLAAIGLVVCAFKLIKRRTFSVPKELVNLSFIAFGISLMAYFSVVYNDTPDYSYVTYFISMWVWLSAAFVVCMSMYKVHGKLTIDLICHYLIAVCVIQCALALLIDFNPIIKRIVDTYVSQDQIFLNEVGRLYGIGAWLDVAGSRFAACLIMIAYIAYSHRFEMKEKHLLLYVVSYVFITIVGNMIARTTTVGNIISIVFLLIMLKPWTIDFDIKSFRMWVSIFLLVLLTAPILHYLYENNPQFKGLFRYGFEGIFSYVEDGVLETSSTNKLKTMYVFPETLKTWIIGDGYYVNPYRTDPYYVGKNVYLSGYYMLTDVGYLRFIFYFGIIGLLGFMSLIVTIVKQLIARARAYRMLFLMLLLANLATWLKVSTDLFLVFALLFCVTNLRDYQESNALLSNV